MIAPRATIRTGMRALMLALLLSIGEAYLPSSIRAWPWFMLVRGPALRAPVVIGRRGGDVHSDIITLYGSLSLAPKTVIDARSRQLYEVAEFWGPNWLPLPTGEPPIALRFERGDTFAKIYAGTARTPPIWVGRREGVDQVPQFIGDSGQAVLKRAGLKLR